MSSASVPVSPSRLRPRITLIILVASLLLWGCSDSADPVETVPASFDAESFAAGLTALEDALATEAWLSFAGLAHQFGLPPTPATVHGVSDPGSHSAAVPVIPQAFLGATLAHDGAGYVVDGQRTGAPADGIRFVLYAIDGAAQPLLGSEIGHADLRDLGSDLTEGFAVAVEVVGSTGTVADYVGSFELDEHGASAPVDVALFDHDGVDLAGRVRNGANETEFELVTGIVDGVEITEVDLSVNGGELTITGVLGADESTGAVDVDFSVVVGADALRLSGHGAEAGIDGAVRLNGDPLATLVGDAEVEVRAATAIHLNDAQTTLLARLPQLVDLLFALVHTAAEPIELN